MGVRTKIKGGKRIQSAFLKRLRIAFRVNETLHGSGASLSTTNSSFLPPVPSMYFPEADRRTADPPTFSPRGQKRNHRSEQGGKEAKGEMGEKKRVMAKLTTPPPSSLLSPDDDDDCAVRPTC